MTNQKIGWIVICVTAIASLCYALLAGDAGYNNRVVVCEIAGQNNQHLYPGVGFRQEENGWSILDRDGHRQYYMSSAVETCFTIDKDMLNGSKDSPHPVQRNNDRSAVLDIYSIGPKTEEPALGSNLHNS